MPSPVRPSSRSAGRLRIRTRLSAKSRRTMQLGKQCALHRNSCGYFASFKIGNQPFVDMAMHFRIPAIVIELPYTAPMPGRGADCRRRLMRSKRVPHRICRGRDADYSLEGSQCHHAHRRGRGRSSSQRGHADDQGRCRHNAGSGGVTGTTDVRCSAHNECGRIGHLGLAPPASHGAGRMMFSWIPSPLGSWLPPVGTVFATLLVARLKGCAAGKTAWEEKRRAVRERAMRQSTDIRHEGRRR